MAKSVQSTQNRGKIETIKLKRAIVLNGAEITRAIIEIDHVNYGLDSKTGLLKKTKRSQFTVRDIEKFLLLLDGESIMPSDYKGKRLKFNIRINCPVRGKFYGKEFVMIFDTDYSETDVIYTITLYPGW